MKNDTLQCQGHETKPVNGGVAKWIAHMTCKRSVVSSKAPVVSLSKKLYPHFLVLVSSRNGFEHVK